MKQHRTKKHSSNYCRNCKTKVRKYRVFYPFCGKFIFAQFPILLLAIGAFVGGVYLILIFLNSLPPLELPFKR